MASPEAGLFPDIEPRHDPGGKIKLRVPHYWKSDALFSPCDRYRYTLSRKWDDRESGMCMFMLMNPSTADIAFNDPTIAKCCRFAQRWGFSGIYIGNVFAYRATDNRRLRGLDDPVGPDNIKHLLQMASSSDLIIVGHGTLHKKLQAHSNSVCDALVAAGHDLSVLDLSSFGVPVHPLYLPEVTEPRVWRNAA